MWYLTRFLNGGPAALVRREGADKCVLITSMSCLVVRRTLAHGLLDVKDRTEVVVDVEAAYEEWKAQTRMQFSDVFRKVWTATEK